MPPHPDFDDAFPAAWPEPLRLALLQCARGDIPPNVALMQVFVALREAKAAENALSTAIERLRARGATQALHRIGAAIKLWKRLPDAFAVVNRIIELDSETSPTPADRDPAQWGATFARALEISPEASVALYSFGCPRLLDQATTEVIERMRAWRLIAKNRACMEIGCGIGRFLERLAREMRVACGIDVCHSMIEAARGRCAGLANVYLVRTSGRDLAAFADASFDLVYSVDTFPYIVAAGHDLACRHVCESQRVLRPGGLLLILNFSYRNDLEADRAQVAHLAARAQFDLLVNGTREFSLWDAAAFLLRRAAH